MRTSTVCLILCSASLISINARGDELQLNATGSFYCGFDSKTYPYGVPYTGEISMGFSAHDNAGNPIEGHIDLASNSSACAASLPQVSAGWTNGFETGQYLFGEWSYLGHTYTLNEPGSYEGCRSDESYLGCNVALTSDTNGDLKIVLSQTSAQSGSWISSSEDIQGTATLNTIAYSYGPDYAFDRDIGDFYSSSGTFSVGEVPEPAAWSLIVCAGTTLLLIRKRLWKLASRLNEN